MYNKIVGTFEKLKQSKAVKVLNNFADGMYFLPIIAVFAFIAHITAVDILGFYVIAIATAYLLVFHDNPLICLCTILFAPCAISRENASERDMSKNSYYLTNPVLPQLIVIFIVLLAALIFRLVVYKEYKLIFIRRKLSLSFVLVGAVLLLGGLFSFNQNGANIKHALMIFVCMFLPYTFIINTVDLTDRRNIKYLMYFITVFALVCSASIAHVYIVEPSIRIGGFNKGDIQIGWSGPNSTGTLLALSIPATFYLVRAAKMPAFYYVCALANMIALIFTYSRAALLIAVPVFFVILIYTCFKSVNLVVMRAAAVLTLLLAFVAMFLFRDEMASIFAFFIKSGVNDSGRFDLIKYGWDAFVQAPVLGVGQSYLQITGKHFSISFHNTICHYLFTCGIVGLCAYLFHRFYTLYILCRYQTRNRLFYFAIIFTMLINGLLDIVMANGISLFFYSIVLAFAEADFDKTLTCLPKRRPRTKSKFKNMLIAIKENFISEPIKMIPAFLNN